LSKLCAICGDNITFLSENSLSKEYKQIKICFTCYEYLATAIKGNGVAVERLQDRYRNDISKNIVNYIDSFDKKIDIPHKRNNHKKDEFMNIISNDLSKGNKKDRDKLKTNIIRLDKLSDAKKDRLIRIKIIASILLFISLLFGLLFSFYLVTQGHGVMLAIVMVIVSLGFAFVFYAIKTFLSTILDD